MTTTEHTINDALASLLRATRHNWHVDDAVRSENTGVLKGSSKRPDILIVEPNVAPVVIEAEVVPAATVEKDASERLGQRLATSGRTVLSVVAVRLPLRLRQLAGRALRAELANARDFEFAVFSGASEVDCHRWPPSGWMTGGVAEMSLAVQSAALPERVIEEAADWLVEGVSDTAGLLAEVAGSHPAAIEKICRALKQEDSDQTRRMAMTIVADALLFHEMLAGSEGDLSGICTTEELRDPGGTLSKADVLKEWRQILKVNYWPIFDIARQIVEATPAAYAAEVVGRLAEVADRLIENQLTRSHDLTGAIFQKLIADRKFLAAYYTTPASAGLLAGLALSPDRTPAGGAWGDRAGVEALRVADFACGTGTLLSTVYRMIRQAYELTGGDSRELHAAMMADTLVGCDVMPAAAHLTASMLSGAHPTTRYNRSAIMTVPYGKQADGTIALGSLDLLAQQSAISLLATVAKAAEGTGEADVDPWVKIPDSTFDLAIMNPPFTRPTGHEGEKVGVPIPMFAAFGSPKEEQVEMAKTARKVTRGTCYHGNAGEASAFLAVADRKLKRGGTLAMVMPISLMAGKAWQASRRLLEGAYRRLVLVTIAAARTEDTSFSADTGSGECLLVGTKSDGGEGRAAFLILTRRPSSPAEGREIARAFRAAQTTGLRRLEEGPVGGTSMRVGDETFGQAVDAPLEEDGWRLSRVADVALAQTAHQLAAEGRVWLPSVPESSALPLVLRRAAEVGKVGPYHMDISGTEQAGGAVRGPFEIRPLADGGIPTYPVLWSHDAERERTMLVTADTEGVMRPGRNAAEEKIIRERAARIAATATHCHFNRDFRFNSQSTAFTLTERATIGGRAWPSLSLATVEHEKAIVLWGNSSLGLLLYWWWSTKQHSGRGSIPVTALRDFPVLDVTALSGIQVSAAAAAFNDLAGEPLRTVNELATDGNRHELDRRLWVDVLGFDAELAASGGPLDLLRRKLAGEPSVTGGKK